MCLCFADVLGRWVCYLDTARFSVLFVLFYVFGNQNNAVVFAVFSCSSLLACCLVVFALCSVSFLFLCGQAANRGILIWRWGFC